MRYISFDEADPHLSWNLVADAICEGHKLERANVGDLLLQDRSNALLSRGAWIPGLGMALKSMSVFPKNVELDPPMPTIQGGVLLFDDRQGSLIAVLDGILVTKWKTAADSVLAARMLANPEPRTHLMVGAGTVAASILEAYREVFPSINRFVLYNRTKQNAEGLAQSMKDKVPGIEIADDLESACASADLITTATMSKEPVINGDWIAPGTHVDLIGAFKPDMREADDALLKKAELFVDSRETTLGHIGEIDIPVKNGVICESDILGDFYEICSGNTGRSGQKAITVFKNGGGAHLDLMTSMVIYKALATLNV